MKIDFNNLPKHIAIIMDGNGRWAETRGLKRSKGHIAGAKRVEEIIDTANEWGINVITLFTFSTENWNRPKEEVSLLMEMIDAIVKKKLGKMMKENIRFKILGCENRIPEPVVSTIRKGMNDTKDNTGMVLNLAFNYGSRQEIIDAVKNISRMVRNGEISEDDIDEEMISNNLYTKTLPDPDLMIRTSGELRISNFLLWQLSYSELYFTNKFWPEFNKDEFLKAILEYQRRKRRFGGLDPER